MAKGQKRFKTPRRVGRQSSTDSNGETGQDQTLTRLSLRESTSQHNKESSSVLTENHCGIFDKTIVQDVDRSSHATGVDVNSKLKCFGQRKRKIHVDVVECVNFSESETGSKALTHPHQIKKSSKKRNRGLQPRSRIKRLKSTQSCSSSNVHDPQTGTDAHSSTNTFTTATSLELLIQTPTKLHDLSQSSSRVQKQKRNHRGKRFMPQKNTLLKYFAIKKTEGPSCTISDTDSADHDVSGKNLKDFTSPNKTWNTSKMYSPITKITDVIYKSDLLPDLSRSSRLKRSDVHCNKSLFAGREDGQFKHSGGEYSSTAYTSCESNHSKSFGLLGDALVICNCVDNASCPTASSSLTDTTLFEHLPAEVVEHIFCQLPILDLCLNCNRVCTQWNEKISHPKFIPWKKLYHRLRKNHGDSYSAVDALMTKANLNLPSKSLLGLIKFMLNFKPVTASNMAGCLAKHQKYELAYALIRERAPDCMKNKIPNPWCVMAALVVTSSCVADVGDILSCLTVPLSQCTTLEILECLYCLATMLYGMHLKHGPDVWTGMHYRVFYTLYLFENASVSTHGMLQESMTNTSGQQSIVRYSDKDVAIQMTHEQMRIVKCDLEAGEVVKIVAFAGTGKTSTLVRYTQMRPAKKFLLLVYNKSVCDHAKKQFPHNVTCKTGHALAYGAIGRRYTSKFRGSLKVYEVTQILPPRKGDNLFVRAKFVIDTLNNFLVSDHSDISTVHVPNFRQDDDGLRVPVEHDAKIRYVDDAEYLWSLMKDVSNKSIGMTHDGYLKLYQMSGPRLDSCDIILIDEAQDLTPAVIDIVMKQYQCKILVGDPHQQIYSFRGAINAMQKITSTKVFYLTQSFRFGPEIAHVAASCLEVFKNIKQKTIVGHGKSGCISGEQVGQMAIISRSNFTVFSEAVKMCCYSNEPCRAAFVGGIEAFGFGMLQDMYTLMLSPEDRAKEKCIINNTFIKMFQSFSELERYASRTVDTELAGKIRIVRTFNHTLPMCLSRIRQKCVHDISTADVLFSTAHKSKGLEFSTVRITDDFIASHGLGISLSDILINVPEDEANLLYVAVTRAKHSLQLSPMLMQVLANNGECFEYPVLSSTVQAGQMKCLQTDAEFQPKALTLKRNPITLTDNSVTGGGYISPVMLTADKHVFHELLGSQQSDPPSSNSQHNSEVVNHDFQL